VKEKTRGEMQTATKLITYNKTIAIIHYPSSCPLLKPQLFGDWILTPSSSRTYSFGDIK
jgi:hypothetical protein